MSFWDRQAAAPCLALQLLFESPGDDPVGVLQEGRRLGRIATVGADGTPHVVPVGMWTYNAEQDAIDVTGHEFEQSKKFRDVQRSGRAAIVRYASCACVKTLPIALLCAAIGSLNNQLKRLYR